MHKRDTSRLTGPRETFAEVGRDPRSVGILLSSTAGVLSPLTDSGMTLRLLLFLRDCRETEPLGSLTSSNCEIVVEPGDSGTISYRTPGSRTMSGSDSMDGCLSRAGDEGAIGCAISCGGGRRMVESFSARGIKPS